MDIISRIASFATEERQKSEVDSINKQIEDMKRSGFSAGGISDTYHTFDELYHHRAILFATICNSKAYNHLAWKSLQHDDPDQPMYDGMFIVGIETPDGQATYHYDIKPYWNFFHVKELERAPKYDGHTPAEAIERIMSLWKIENETGEYHQRFVHATGLLK